MRICKLEQTSAMMNAIIERGFTTARAITPGQHLTVFIIIVALRRRYPCKGRVVQHASDITRMLLLIRRR